MTLPASFPQLLVLLVSVIPGFVFQTARIRVRGRNPSDTELTSRILYALAGSAIFGLAYIVVFGSTATEAATGNGYFPHHPRLAAGAAFAGAVLVPALAALAVSAVLPVSKWLHPVRTIKPSNWARIDPRPSAWDVAFGEAEPSFVRVRTKDGTWFAGYFGRRSYASSFPDPQNLYVELSYQIAEDGEIGEVVENSSGAVIDCRDAALIEFVRKSTSSSEDAAAAHRRLTTQHSRK